MKKLPLLSLAAACLVLPNCAGIPGESPEHMQQRVDRQDAWVERHQEKRRIHSEAMDRRYDGWWDSAMGRDENSW